ncbi:MAG: hypothetical protein JXA46_16850 [Dehalococcoidales bacterium]|nr:hypothetical protein [Dehalococcoidales bacterium]
MIDLESTEQIGDDVIDSVMRETAFCHNNNRFVTTSNIVSGEYDLSRAWISIRAEKALANTGNTTEYLNKLMALMYYSACRVKYGANSYPAMILQGCAVKRHGIVHLFTGPKGIGKSTLAGMCRPSDGAVISDEMVLITNPEQTKPVCIQGAPILGEFPPRRITAPAGCIFILKQGPRTSVRKLDQSYTYLKLIRQIYSPAYIGQRNERSLYAAMADFSARVIERLPVYELEFNLDAGSLWKTIDNLEQNILTKEMIA